MCVISKKCNCSKSLHFAMTLNNYQDHDNQVPKELKGGMSYLVMGQEVSETGTPHLQSYCQFSEAKKKCTAINLLGKNWSIAACYSSDQKNFDYCTGNVEKKNYILNNFVELGTRKPINRPKKLICHVHAYSVWKEFLGLWLLMDNVYNSDFRYCVCQVKAFMSDLETLILNRKLCMCEIDYIMKNFERVNLQKFQDFQIPITPENNCDQCIEFLVQYRKNDRVSLLVLQETPDAPASNLGQIS